MPPLEKQSVPERLSKIIYLQILGQPLQLVPPKAKLSELDLDIFNIVDLVEFVEKEFGIEISDQDEKQIETVENLVDLIERLHHPKLMLPDGSSILELKHIQHDRILGHGDETDWILLEIENERRRQIEDEGYTPESDDARYHANELAMAGAAYAVGHPGLWPFPKIWFKSGPARRMLIKAAALIVARIAQLDRKAILAKRSQ
jgi:acyl carrier protein